MEEYLVLDCKFHRAWSSSPHMAHPPAGDILKGQTFSNSEHSLPYLPLWLTQLTGVETGPGGHKHKLCGRQPEAGALHRESRMRAPALLWGPDNTGEQRGLSNLEGAFCNLRELHNGCDVLIWLRKAWYLTRPENDPNYVYWHCIHGINMRVLSPSKRQLGASMYFPCIFNWFHFFTYLWLIFLLSSCKKIVWKNWVESPKVLPTSIGVVPSSMSFPYKQSPAWKQQHSWILITT